ncbi:uncharacterized [Tachysurus ichikawai]
MLYDVPYSCAHGNGMPLNEQVRVVKHDIVPIPDDGIRVDASLALIIDPKVAFPRRAQPKRRQRDERSEQRRRYVTRSELQRRACLVINPRRHLLR